MLKCKSTSFAGQLRENSFALCLIASKLKILVPIVIAYTVLLYILQREKTCIRAPTISIAIHGDTQWSQKYYAKAFYELLCLLFGCNN